MSSSHLSYSWIGSVKLTMAYIREPGKQYKQCVRQIVKRNLTLCSVYEKSCRSGIGRDGETYAMGGGKERKSEFGANGAGLI